MNLNNSDEKKSLKNPLGEDRPDPDTLLRDLRAEELSQGKGQLRIFLGMCAGVGKTYAMLRAAHQKVSEGVHVVIGVVETHGRPETVELVRGLIVVPKKKIDYRGTVVEELDLDEILSRKPDLVVVDELAHSNISGSRHKKRYQDVLELLDAGIDVYTAFNVQHLESRKDAVEGITGIPIRETVPDSVLEIAKLIELIDIAPAELLKRLKEGKVYLGEKAARAAENFFKIDKLTALREIALRMTAERVDQDLQRFIGGRRDGTPWQTNERLLVGISHSPYSEKLIRATRRLAYNLEAPWIALHVDTGITLNDEDQSQLAKNLHLARELRGEVITTTDIDVASAVRRICRAKNVTQVVVGRPTRRWFRDLIENGSLLDRLVRESLEVDVHVIRHEGATLDRPALIDEISYYRSKTGVKKYGYTLCVIAVVGMVGQLIENFIGYRAVGFIFLLVVIVVGLFGSIGAVVFAAAASALAWNYIFIPPKYTFAISNPEDFLMCVAFFGMALITGFLTHRLRFHERVMREREERTNVLYEVLQDIANATEKAEFLSKVTARVGRLLDAKCGVILKSPLGKLEFSASSDYAFALDEKDQAVGQWSFENKASAGWSTDTLAQSRALFLPLVGSAEAFGLFIFEPQNKSRKLDLEKEGILFSIVRQLGVSIEKHFLLKRLTENQRLKDSEELHQTLLNSISHEMRTPLTAILGASSALEQDPSTAANAHVRNIAIGLQSAGERLNRIIENLLDMSRLNSGIHSLNLEWHDTGDLLNIVLSKLEKALSAQKLETNFLEELYLMRMDHRLMEHAISNLIMNATMYTPVGSVIKISQRKTTTKFIIEISDEGPGVPDGLLERIFEKFFRVPGSPTGGTGLGLSIVKSIIELHKGQIRVKNKVPHGLCFTIEFSLELQPLAPPEDRT